MSKRNNIELLLLFLPVACGQVAAGSSPPAPRPPRAGVLCDGGPFPTPPPTDPKSLPPGSRDPEQIRSVIRSKTLEVLACYGDARWRTPTARGRVQLWFHLTSDGDVTGACVQEPALRDGEALECILAELRTLSFGQGKPVNVVYPFVFEPR